MAANAVEVALLLSPNLGLTLFGSNGTTKNGGVAKIHKAFYM